MRSYYAHLETASGQDKKNILQKPTFRSSAIFPVINIPGISSRILFMGYWILKRNIKQIACVATLRTDSGDVLYRQTQTIEEPKTYTVELRSLLESAGLSGDTDFQGSLEIEFFSTVHLVFPFPAVSINYYGPKFSSVVHTAQRVYNDFDDLKNNSRTAVPESGFNVYADEDHEPIIGIINGPEPLENGKIEMEFFNFNKEILTGEIDVGRMNSYQTLFIYPAQYLDLANFLNGKPGAGKLRFKVNWIFPRLLVGTIQRSLPAMTITHTYYDCTEAVSDSDYWLPEQPEWYPASLMIPVMVDSDHFTTIYFYPIYSPSRFVIDLEIYDSSGKCLETEKNLLQIHSPAKESQKIDFGTVCKKLNISSSQDLGARIIARDPDNGRIPARIKIGFDVGHSNDPEMACNICTNLQPFNPPMETKPSTFRWAPILADQPKPLFWIMNSSPAKLYEKKAEVILTFFREEDATTLVRKIELPSQGFVVIRPNDDHELKRFFGGRVGWCTAVSTNPYTTTYYFADSPYGIVGGDHGF